MAKEKFRRTVITVEVLSRGPYNPESLQDVHYDISSGDCSGDWKITESKPVTKKEMKELLKNQGSDEEFADLM